MNRGGGSEDNGGKRTMRKLESFDIHFEKPVNEIRVNEFWQILDKLREENPSYRITVSKVIPKERRTEE